MAEFIQQRISLNDTRASHESSRLEVFALTERLKLVDQEIAALGRQNNPENTANKEKVAALMKTRDTLEDLRKTHQHTFETVTADLSGIVEEYVSLTDPRVQLGQHFKNTTPLLLLPTRMETRFKTVMDPQTGAQKKQLWVRVYPDTCMVSTFDPQLSPQELRNGARFWAEYYAAGEVIDGNNPDPNTVALQKAAWGFLARVEGAGRAAWITQAEEAKPLPGSIFPKRNSDKTIILTIATEDNSILANQATIFAFFKALWLAGKNEEKINTTKATLPDADEVIEKYLPVNFYEPLPAGLKRGEADVQVALVLLKDLIGGMGKTNSWSQAARVSIGPERFVLQGYKNGELVIDEMGNFIPSPLPVGFNPSSTEDNNFKPTEEGDLEIPDDVKWIIDFDQAVAKGMGFRVNLSSSAENGVDRLFVIGIRLSADESTEGGQKLLSELLDHHYYSSKGFSMVRQGTPTNNTEKESAGSSGIDEVEMTFKHYFKQQFSFKHSEDWQKKPDGQWLAEWLGLPEDVFRKVLNADGLDQADALNMNLALWPGTLGYAMDAMMKPVFNETTMDTTRQFFSMFVAGRGTVPAIRIGNQPYGILPATAFKRQRWMYGRSNGMATEGPRFHAGIPTLDTPYLRSLYEILIKIRADWEELLVPKVAHVSAEKPLDSHQQLLDIIGLHPNSVEFHKRYLQTLEMLFSYAYFIFTSDQGQMAFDKMEFGRAYQLLLDLGYNPAENKTEGELPLLSKLYGLEDSWEHKVIVDTIPLSETKEIRGYTADGKNYITALIEAASKSMDALRKHEGFSEDPTALLFSFLKFSLEQGYFDTAVRLHETSQVFTPAQSAFARTEQAFVHMKVDDKLVESRYAVLYKKDDRIAANITVAERVSELIRKPIELAKISPGLQQQMEALRHLEKASTARLERAFVEHLDCCSYRLDAWQQAMTKLQLMLMRNNQPVRDQEPETQARQGIYLGAYGWLENVVPDTEKVLTPKVLNNELKKDFKESYVTDQENAGFIHAPSVNQAVTAAVLRNAFLTNGKVDNNKEFAVNLSSERVRLALSVIEGIQNGQPLAALLGYRFERMLHDQKNLVNKGIYTYIYALRKRFPLNANQISETKVENDPTVDPNTVPISAIEASNVVNGKKLIDHVRKQSSANKNYPFGFTTPTQLPPADSDIGTAINDAVNFIMNIEDAIADLGMAESVHQVCLGNYDRAAGVLESYSNGNYPQTPDVIRTPRSGPTLTHRVGIQIDFIPSVPYDPLNPRKSVEPSLNNWLAAMLPPMGDIVCSFRYINRSTNTSTTEPVSMALLGLSPIDLLYVLNTEGKAALTELDEVVLHYVHQHKTPRLDADIALEYINRPADTTKFSVFEIMSLMKSLRALVLQSANLKPTDVSMPRETSAHTAIAITLPSTRVDAALADMENKLVNYKTQILDVLNVLPIEPNEAESENIRAQVDTYLATLISHLSTLGRFGLPETGVGDLYRLRQDTLSRLRKKVEVVIERFEKRKTAYVLLETAFDPLAADAIEQLQNMEAYVTTQYSKLDELALLDVQNKKSLFDAKLLGLKSIINPNTLTGIFSFLESIRTETNNLGNFDLETIDLVEEEKFIVRVVLDNLKQRAQSFYALGMKATLAANDDLIDLTTLDLEKQAKQIEAAAKALLGQEFKMIPRYDLDDQQQFEVSNAWNSASLLDYVKTEYVPPYEEPEEDWLHGVARVREKVHHVENCLLLREALGLDEAQLDIHPLQFPFKTEKYHWLALPFPAEVKLEEGDVLLYTAITNAVATSPQYTCGFLVDEWTEVIPLENETTGLSFHYDRPNAEAPQTMLLVTPTTLNGNWDWQDIVDALHDTLDTARLRAVEPYHIDQTLYARYLPSVVSPVTRYPITIGMYLADLRLSLPLQ